MKNETVEIIEIQGEYHIKPTSGFYQHYKTHTVPKWLFDLYVKRRHLLEDVKMRLKRKFHPPKDVKFRRERNHVVINEGEIHHLNEDGTTSIYPL